MSQPKPEAYRAICSECWGQNPRCAKCLGAQYVVRHPYAEGAGEAGDDLADLIAAERRPAARQVPTAILSRMAELADALEAGACNDVARELIALVREANRG